MDIRSMIAAFRRHFHNRHESLVSRQWARHFLYRLKQRRN